jgi:hypothetical protein
LTSVKAGKAAAGHKLLKLNKIARATASIAGRRREATMLSPPVAARVVLWDEMGAGRRFGLARR